MGLMPRMGNFDTPPCSGDVEIAWHNMTKRPYPCAKPYKAWRPIIGYDPGANRQHWIWVFVF